MTGHRIDPPRCHGATVVTKPSQINQDSPYNIVANAPTLAPMTDSIAAQARWQSASSSVADTATIADVC